MDWAFELVVVTASLLFLLISGMWASIAIGFLGTAYLYFSVGANGLKALGLIAWGSVNSFPLAAIPLFILMAEILLKSGVADRVYRGITPLASRLPGGLLQTNIIGCGVFSAISGSSTATAAAIGTVSLPQLKAQGYRPSIATGSLAAGGTLGILIPPSIPLIIYSTFAEISAAKLFIAGILPGLCLVMLFCGFLAVANAILSSDAKDDKRHENRKIPWLSVANDLFPFILLIILVLGSIYAGIATPTEAAAVGCLGAILVGSIWGNLRFANFRSATSSTVKTTGAIMLIVMMALVFSYAVAITGLPKQLATWVGTQEMSTITLILFLGSVYLVMGCIIDSIGMMVITVPLFLPIVEAVGIDPVLFGIMVVIFIEIGLITPPIGLNLFVIHSLDPDGQLLPIIKGAVPFVIIMILMAVLLWIFPAIALWLPSRM
jgi:C4-dicarboxylate transporter DctM subunit|tara:strand:- start:90 stop:1391 length:1302 start_codon:yes stop_codon:yes gene_type:complete